MKKLEFSETFNQWGLELAKWGEGGIGQLNFRNFLIKTGGVVAIPKRGVAIALKILNKSNKRLRVNESHDNWYNITLCNIISKQG